MMQSKSSAYTAKIQFSIESIPQLVITTLQFLLKLTCMTDRTENLLPKMPSESRIMIEVFYSEEYTTYISGNYNVRI